LYELKNIVTLRSVLTKIENTWDILEKMEVMTFVQNRVDRLNHRRKQWQFGEEFFVNFLI
jgi:hypothetical protein